MTKYKQIAPDQVLRFAFRIFDRRIVTVSRAPVFSPAAAARRFDRLTKYVSETERENVALNNTSNFFARGGL